VTDTGDGDTAAVDQTRMQTPEWASQGHTMRRSPS